MKKVIFGCFLLLKLPLSATELDKKSNDREAYLSKRVCLSGQLSQTQGKKRDENLFVRLENGICLRNKWISRKKLLEISQSHYWKRLMHYKPSVLGTADESQLDGMGFFFSSRGKKDSFEELLANIENLFDSSSLKKVGFLKQPPRCAFPLRYEFLKKELNDHDTSIVKCEKLDEYLLKFNPRSISLIFSTAYPNNPGSMFGHTFFRINSEKRSNGAQRAPLLDYSLSFAAFLPNDDGGLAFAVKGLLGGYVGRFSMVPYYAKVSEYNHWNSRDLWEYELNLSKDETLTLLKHAWEIETTSYFDYYFFYENCAYHLLSLIEVAKPEWFLTPKSFYITPADTLKRLVGIPGAIQHVEFRPSLRRSFWSKYTHLNKSQRDQFKKIKSNQWAVSETQDPMVLESMISLLEYKNSQEEDEFSEKDKELLHQSLLRRSHLREAPLLQKTSFRETVTSSRDSKKEAMVQTSSQNLQKIFYGSSNQPELGHGSYRWGWSLGSINDSFQERDLFEELHFRFAYHDLLDSDLGYEPFSELSFPQLKLRRNSKGQVRLEELGLFSVTSLFPYTVLENRFSWRVRAQVITPHEYACEDCHLFEFQSGGGVSFEVFSPKTLSYFLLMMEGRISEVLNKGYGWGPGFEGAILSNPLPSYKIHLKGRYFLNGKDGRPNYWNWQFHQSYALSQNWSLRAQYDRMVPLSSAESRFSQTKVGVYETVLVSFNYFFDL